MIRDKVSSLNVSLVSILVKVIFLVTSDGGLDCICGDCLCVQRLYVQRLCVCAETVCMFRGCISV